MANRKITELTALTAPAVDDILPIIDISEGVNANKNKKITYGELFKNIIDGTASAPSIAFDSSATTGLYRSAANELSVATGGNQRLIVDSTGNTTVKGNLVVQGTTTTVSSTTITVADKNLELATGQSSDTGADGGGLTIKGASDKTWNWVNATDAWTSNQNIDLASGKVYEIAGTSILSATTLGSSVVNSSLTSVGTLGTLAVTGEIDAGSLDVSGNADIDGTLEADAYTVNGIALNEYIADTVGGMVSSNTETNITVTYDDSDNTLDFVIGTLNQDTTGNSATATALQTARTIGGVSFDGTANISLPGVNQTGNQNTTGSAATLTTARTIGGVSFDGSANISLPGVNAAGNQNTSGTAAGLSGTPNITVGVVTAGSLDISGGADIDGTLEADAYTVDGTALNEYIADTVGAMVSSNTETNIAVTYDDSDNTLDFSVINITGNAATATALQTARTIGGVSFDGTANITLPGVNATGNQNTTGSAATLTTARTIGGVSFNGSANIDLPGVNAAGNQNTSGTSAGLTGTPNITVGDVVAASLDISGNVDVDGTLETDALTINGTSLSETIADTVGAMVTSNTETGVTVTYDDADNTLDFVVGTLNQNTTGNAATATALATARAINGVNFDGTAAITVTAAAGTLTGNTLASGVTSSSLTSVGTLSSLTTSGNVIVGGNLTVNGTQTIVNSTTITVDDKNLELGSVASPSDTTANGGGITLKGATDKTFNWVSSNAAWTSSEHLDLASGKVLKIAGTQVLSNAQYTGNAATATALATARAINGVNFDGTGNITVTSAAGTLSGNTLASGVTASSLTSVGTLAGLTTSSDVVIQNQKDIRFSEASGNGTNYVALQAPAAISSNYTLTLPAADGSSGQHLKTDGSGNLSWETPVSAASDLTGSTLASGVTASSLTSVGTLTGLTTSGNILMAGTGCIDVAAGTTAQRPGSPNAGMFRYNTTLSKFEGHDGSAWGEIGGSGGGGASFYINTLSSSSGTGGGSATFNGTAYRFTLSNAPATGNAAQMLVSVGGVIQKANSGTSQPSEGYAISGNDIIFGAAPASAASWFIITYGALNAGEPTDNTVNEAKLKVSNSPTNGYFLSAQSGNTGGLTWAAVDLSSKLSLTGGTLTGALSTNSDIRLAADGGSGRLEIGALSGGDLQLYHATNSYIINKTGDLYLYTSDGNDFYVAGQDGHTIIKGNDGGSVELFHNNTKRLETTSTGITVSGHIDLDDANFLKAGTNDDLWVGHDGSHSYINHNGTGGFFIQTNAGFHVQQYGTAERLINANSNGNVELFYDSSKKFETTSAGPTTTGTVQTAGDVKFTSGSRHKFIGGGSGGNLELGTYSSSNSSRDVHLEIDSAGDLFVNDGQKFKFGTGSDLQIYHNGSNSVISNATGYLNIDSNGGILYLDGSSINIRVGSENSEENAIICNNNAAVELYYDNVKKFGTRSNGVDIIGNTYIADNDKISFGGSSDLLIYHSGSNNILESAGTTEIHVNKGQTENMAKFIPDGAVELYHNNVKTFATDGHGIFVLGPEGGTANVYIYADEADDDADKWSISADPSSSALTINNRLSGSFEKNIKCIGNGSVELYYDNSKKLETTSSGVNIPGTLAVDEIDLGNTEKINLGVSDALQIWSDGSDSIIRHTKSGSGQDLILESDTTTIIGKTSVNGGDVGVKFIADGAVELYYDNSKRLETSGNGTIIYGPEGTDATLYIYADEGDDNHDKWKLTASAADSNFYLSNYASGSWESSIVCHDSGGVELYYDNTKRFETTSVGAHVWGNLDFMDNAKIRLGTGTDLEIYHDGTNSVLINNTNELYQKTATNMHLRVAGDEKAISMNANGAVELYYDNAKKFETTSAGVQYSGKLTKTGSGDAIHLESGSALKLSAGSGTGSNKTVNMDARANGSYARIHKWTSGSFGGGSYGNYSEAWYDGGTYRNITATGSNFQVGWHWCPESNNTYNLGSSSLRWANLYINDLQLSNEGSQNSVDGTWGDWTLQEGEEDIFMINNRSGKKYKMALQEVS